MTRTRSWRTRAAALAIVPVLWLLVAEPVAARDAGPYDALRSYIKTTWATLTRSARDLPRAAPDPKLALPAGGRWPVYVARDVEIAEVERELARSLSEERRRGFELRRLPSSPAAIAEHGLLYLPRPYVVPGGRFNEMYGWDSYFIVVGLLRDGEVQLARDMVDNFLYEIEHYGAILNANRSYYLTRSQPPFLTRMLLGVYRATHDREWLARALPAALSYYGYWTREPHLLPELGLSRYFDAGEGPAPEVVSAERDDSGRTHYERAREYLRTHAVSDYDASLFYDRSRDALTPLFFKGDRAMRESGFDPSARFGPLGIDTIHYAPVCLNALLYVMERDIAELREMLELGGAEEWRARAARRLAAVDRLLWDEPAGLYLDYQFKAGKRRQYLFATTFFPLWAGMASSQQAARVFESLPKLEAPGGLLTSTEVTGNQWDAPFGWAPLQLIAVEGLRRYGYDAAADRLATKFVELVAKEFADHGTILEKYDVVRRKSDLAEGLRFGYSTNETGFGWTNGVVLELLAGLGR